MGKSGPESHNKSKRENILFLLSLVHLETVPSLE